VGCDVPCVTRLANPMRVSVNETVIANLDRGTAELATCSRQLALLSGPGIADRQDFPSVAVGLHEIDALAAEPCVDLVVRLTP
jgi:hypothetical protein